MTITDPDIIKRVQAARAKQKADYETNRGKKPARTVTVTICKACKSHIGTFRWVPVRTEDGKTGRVLVHVNCPGKPPNHRADKCPYDDCPTHPKGSK